VTIERFLGCAEPAVLILNKITCLHDVGWFTLTLGWCGLQNQDCWLSITKKSLNSHQTLYIVRRWGLGLRLMMACHCLVYKPLCAGPLTFLFL